MLACVGKGLRMNETCTHAPARSCTATCRERKHILFSALPGWPCRSYGGTGGCSPRRCPHIYHRRFLSKLGTIPSGQWCPLPAARRICTVELHHHSRIVSERLWAARSSEISKLELDAPAARSMAFSGNSLWRNPSWSLEIANDLRNIARRLRHRSSTCVYTTFRGTSPPRTLHARIPPHSPAHPS